MCTYVRRRRQAGRYRYVTVCAYACIHKSDVRPFCVYMRDWLAGCADACSLVCLLVGRSVCLFACLFGYWCLSLFVSLFAGLFVCVCVCLLACLLARSLAGWLPWLACLCVCVVACLLVRLRVCSTCFDIYPNGEHVGHGFLRIPWCTSCTSCSMNG